MGFWSVLGLAWCVTIVAAQSQECYTSGNIVGAVFATALVMVVLFGISLLVWRIYWKGKRGKHLVLVTDPEKGDDFAFDNPGFKEGTPIGRTGVKEEKKQQKWQNWAPLTNLSASDKPRALDDSFVAQPQMNLVPLRSHDFTGLGFNICGNMRDGIFVKDILHRGPAYESGRIVPGDRIESIKISLRHMVFEDALTILSYASPYEVQLEVESGATSRPSTLLRNKRASASPGPSERIYHPFYRSHSITDFMKINKSSSSKWVNDSSIAELSNGDLRPAIIETSPIEKMQKVGVRVLPPSTISDSMKIEAEKTQNVRNSFIESSHGLSMSKKSPTNTLKKGETFSMDKSRTSPMFSTNKSNLSSDFDEIDLSYSAYDDKITQGEISRKNSPSPGLKETNMKSLLVKSYNNLKEKIQNATLKSEKNNDEGVIVNKNEYQPEDTTNSRFYTKSKSGSLEKESDNNPMCLAEAHNIPEEVQKAGMAARSNRKSIIEDGKTWERVTIDEQKDMERKRKGSISGDSSNEGDSASQKKNKRKAPLPPQVKSDEEGEFIKTSSEIDEVDIRDNLSDKNNSMDSVDTDSEQGEKSGTTIELNSSHITVHNAPDSETSRKTASLGDLSRIGNDQPIIVLERAVSLDLADGTPGGGKKRKAPLPPQEEFLDDGLTFSKEAKIDALVHTRLKHSSDFGRLEDAVKLNEPLSDNDTDLGNSEPSTPEPQLKMLISSTPMKHTFMPSFCDVDLAGASSHVDRPVSMNKISDGIHISSCSWNSTKDQFVTAANGINSEEEDDIPPELPTSPIPTYVTEIQVVTANKENTDGLIENGTSDTIKRNDVFPQNIPEMSTFMSNNIHRTLNNPYTKKMEINIKSSNLSDDLSSLPSLANLSDTMMTEVNQVSLSQPNSLDPIITTSPSMFLKELRPTGPLIFSNENMSDEQILALKSSPEPIIIDNKMQVPKPLRSNVSVTSIRAGSSRIPVRATPEPTQRKVKKDSFISYSSLNVSPSNEKRHSNGSNESSITNIVLESQK